MYDIEIDISLSSMLKNFLY